MFCRHKQIKKKKVLPGVIGQYLGSGKNMNVMHWNFTDNCVLPAHKHPSEQFGYIIKGGFKMAVGKKKTILMAGDAYFIPPNVIHSFTSVGKTEAIDVFSPTKEIKL